MIKIMKARVNSSMLKYLLIDIHGVLTSGDERKRFLSFIEKTYKINYEQHNALWMKYIDPLDKRIVKASDYIKEINNTFNTHLSLTEYYETFFKYIRINKNLLNHLRQLGNYELCIVSDNFPEISTDFTTLFDSNFQTYRKFYSFEFGMTKRDGLLSKVLKDLHAKPYECLFIDDSSKNIEVANRMGLHTILFESNEQVFKELKNIIKTSKQVKSVS